MTLTIPIDKNFAYRPVAETPEQMKTSFFVDVYRAAEQRIDGILDLSKPAGSDGLLMEYSNIIAFTGGRGAGKTSVMGNVGNLLQSGKRLDGSSWEKNFFLCPPMIDPSHISPDETVIDIVLSGLYNFFKTYCGTHDIFMDRQRKIYQAFSEAFQAVRVICQSREARHGIPDSLEGLHRVTAGNNLRELMSSLVKLLLQEVGRERNAAGCLVLCIDDIDMNIQQGYNICEELRKYLNIPHVIILFSLYISQMNDLVRQQYLNDFGTLLRYGDEITLSESVPDMAKKYLEKLIPFNHRCALPEINFRNSMDITIRYEEREGQGIALTDEVLRLLHDKTGVLLVKNQDGTHAFLPTSLRGVTHLISLLQRMESVKLVREEQAYQLDEKERVILGKNLDTLARYIKEYHIVEFSRQSASVLEALITAPQESLNIRVTRMMAGVLDETLTSQIRRRSGTGILQGEKASVGDVLYIMHTYSREEHYADGKDQLFAALFKVLYSIRLLQAFFIDARQDKGLDARKLALRQVLGSLIYHVDDDKVCRGSDLCEILSISDLKDLESSPDFDATLDELLLGTICMGRPEKIGRISRTQPLTPYLNSVDRDDKDISRDALTGKLGNTFQYFIYSYLGCILSPLRDDLAIQNQNYQTWRQKYLSPLPVLSADYIDAYVQGLRRATENTRKSTSSISVAVSKGSRELISDLISRSCVDDNSKNFFTQSLTSFPFMQEDSLVEKYLFSKDSSKQAPTEIASEKRISSLTYYLRKLQGMRSKYESATDVGQLIRKYENEDTSGKLQPEDLDRLKRLSERLKTFKDEFKKRQWETLEDFPVLRNQILQEIDLEIQNAEEELKKLEAMKEESENHARV